MALRHAFLAIAGLAAFTPSAGAQKNATPLFDDFQRFCVATGDVPDAVKRAASGAGVRLVRSFVNGAPPFPTSMTLYDHQRGDRHWSITAGTEAHPPTAAEPQGILTHNCDVTAHEDDDASLAALRQWARVGPQRVLHTDATIFVYAWEQRGATHLVLPDTKDALHDAVTGGRVWNLVLIKSPRYLSAELMNRLPTQ